VRGILDVALVDSRLLRLLAFLLAFNGIAQGQALFQKPVKVLGDPNYIGTASSPNQIEGNGPNVVEGREMSGPSGIALDMSVSPPILYIADAGNNRVLGYQYATQMTPGAFADIILGQIDRFSNLPEGPGTTHSVGLNTPSGLAADASGNVYVADNGNNRILRFPKPATQPTGSAQFPDLVIGQTSFNTKTANAGGIGAATLSLSTGARAGLAFDSSGNLWVADTTNNRVLRFPAAVLKTGANGPKADLVVGQPDFVTTTAVTLSTSTMGLSAPQGVAFDAAGRLLVTDHLSRVVVYPPAISSNAAVALRIAGIDTSQPSTSATQIELFGPLGVTATSSSIIVADTQNNRVMVFPTVDTWPAASTQFSPSATQVLGQPSYTVSLANQGNGDASASTLNLPLDVASSGSELYVADEGNNRVLVFPYVPSGPTPTASRVIGQLDFPYYAPNLIEGKEFDIAFANGVSGSAILDQSSTPPHLYVADTQNNRILGFRNFASLSSGLQAADLVIGQPDFKRSQINYPTNTASTPNQQGLNQPTALAVDSAGNLYVADTGNSRILRFPAPYASGKAALESADIVIGQSSFSATVTDATAQTVFAPTGIALTADAANASVTSTGWLVVSDTGHHRVLFFQKPFSTGMSANKVLGSLNFNTFVQGGSNGPPQFNTPRGLAVDPTDRVVVADTGNHRVQIFNSASSINNYDTPPVSITAGLTSPVSVSAYANGYWVADLGAGALIHYPLFNQLLIGNKASDTSMTAYGPFSVFTDSYANILTCDSANRVLYYAPQITAESAADYSTRALTAGMFASLWPTISTNVIGAGTAPESGFPLPITLADTQVLINNVPAPLYYVSPGQINVELPNGLPGGGTATLQVVRQSTGQIYGGAEIQLAAADPGLFTSNGSGGGPVAAINVVDGSVNSASNPVARGQYISLYGTGEGSVPNAPPDGNPAPGAIPTATQPQVLLGPTGPNATLLNSANITYSGLAPTLVGVWQINILIPATAPTGSVPITIYQNSVPSNDVAATAGATTISIK
jgi:uncharacterized protein (TIGR03437 family)